MLSGTWSSYHNKSAMNTMHTLITFVLWILIGMITSYFAKQRGRDPLIWFMIGMLLGLLGLILLFLLPNLESVGGKDQKQVNEQPPSSEPLPIEWPTLEPASAIENKEWFYLDAQRQTQGPISFRALKAAWGEGRLLGDSLVWSEGMDNWKKIQELAELSQALQN